LGDAPSLQAQDAGGGGNAGSANRDAASESDPDAGLEASAGADGGDAALTCARACAWLVCSGGQCDDPVQTVGGSDFTCVRRRAGRVQCWGQNNVGQLGRGEGAPDPTPRPVQGLSDAVEIAAGGAFACARRATGIVVCWGSNGSKQLGNEAAGASAASPVAVQNLTDAAELALGLSHACARRTSGQVVCWGGNTSGQLGDGSTDTRSTPAAVSNLTGAMSISAGVHTTCARRAAEIVCWGANDGGQLGSDAGARSLVPVAVPLPSDAAAPALGRDHACALRSGGQVVCWGYNSFGQLGNGSYPSLSSSAVPVTVSGLSDAVQIVSGNLHTCARRRSGAVLCWGDGSRGELGNDLREARGAPVAATGLGDGVDLAAGDHHTCAVRSDGNLACWGFNEGANPLGYSTYPDNTSATPRNLLPPAP
jgi:alpha-tubulin suppressor-like RCC1 family protein